VTAGVASAGPGPVSLGGPANGTVHYRQRICSEDLHQVHHDGTFESGFAWEGPAVDNDYIGCFGEAFERYSRSPVCSASRSDSLLAISPSSVPIPRTV